MLNQNIKSELIVELSDEQQEMVAGGLDFGISFTQYHLKQNKLTTVSTSGPEGSTAMGFGKSIDIDTFGGNAIFLA